MKLSTYIRNIQLVTIVEMLNIIDIKLLCIWQQKIDDMDNSMA
jgi:hypothetical protein